MKDAILRSIGLRKDFRGFTAVDGVDLGVAEGSIHAVIGPNGAGKTTFFNLLTRFLEPSAGEIHYAGANVTALTPAELARKGLVRSFQISSVFPSMSVLANVRLALIRKAGLDHAALRCARSLGRFDDEALRYLEEVGLANRAETLASELPYGSRRALEIATTLAVQPRVMLLDEPTQGMGHEDVDRIIQLVRRVARGRTVLMVEHNMRIVSELADRISVLQRGALLVTGCYKDVSRDPRVVEAYMGTDHATLEAA